MHTIKEKNQFYPVSTNISAADFNQQRYKQAVLYTAKNNSHIVDNYY